MTRESSCKLPGASGDTGRDEAPARARMRTRRPDRFQNSAAAAATSRNRSLSGLDSGGAQRSPDGAASAGPGAP